MREGRRPRREQCGSGATTGLVRQVRKLPAACQPLNFFTGINSEDRQGHPSPKPTRRALPTVSTNTFGSKAKPAPSDNETRWRHIGDE